MVISDSHSCDSSNSCSGNTINCIPNDICDVTCSAINSCLDATINGPINKALTITCTASSSCLSTIINASYASELSMVDCVTGSETCVGQTIYCPPKVGNTRKCHLVGDANSFGSSGTYNLTIYAINGWLDVDILADLEDVIAGKMYCGVDYNYWCNIDENIWWCDLAADADTTCNDPPFVLTTSIPTSSPTTPPPTTSIPTTSVPTSNIPTTFPPTTSISATHMTSHISTTQTTISSTMIESTQETTKTPITSESTQSSSNLSTMKASSSLSTIIRSITVKGTEFDPIDDKKTGYLIWIIVVIIVLIIVCIVCGIVYKRYLYEKIKNETDKTLEINKKSVSIESDKDNNQIKDAINVISSEGQHKDGDNKAVVIDKNGFIIADDSDSDSCDGKNITTTSNADIDNRAKLIDVNENDPAGNNHSDSEDLYRNKNVNNATNTSTITKNDTSTATDIGQV